MAERSGRPRRQCSLLTPLPLNFAAPLSRTCSMPFMAHQVQNHTSEVEKPKATLSVAVAIRPPASSMVGEVREPSTPLTNLLQTQAWVVRGWVRGRGQRTSLSGGQAAPWICRTRT